MMTKTNFKQDLKRTAANLGHQTLAIVSMALCTAVGYQLHSVSDRIRFDSVTSTVFGSASSSFLSIFGMHPIISMLLVPALFVSACALGGLFLWNRTGGK